MAVKQEQLQELLYQALETEIGGQSIYQTAIECAANDDVREEWQKYLEETQNHERVLRGAFERIGLDPEVETPGRLVIRAKGEALVAAMRTALEQMGPSGAQLVAAESIVEAESKDHQNWELIGMLTEHLTGDVKQALTEAHEEVEDEEDEHLYHTMGWSRELWLESLGVPAVLPPPEEAKEVKTAIGAARAKNQREQML
jgi:rubrerythrin